MLKIVVIISITFAFVKSWDILHLDKACTTCAGYNLKGLCESNPDITSDTGSIIRRHGYKYEEHPIKTADDWELTMFHIIPKNNPNNIPVLIQHGLQMDATMWVVVKQRSLGFRLSDLGYDVWLGNYRGTPHTRLLDKNPLRQYFNYSFHEMGIYDIPAMTEHIASINNNGKIIYIGHSMGVSGVLIYSSELPDHANKHLRGIIGLAPAAYMTHNAAVKLFRPLIDFWAIQTRESLKLTGYYALLDNKRFSKDMAIHFCTGSGLRCQICRHFVQFGTGHDLEQFSAEDVPLLYSYCLYANPMKVITHYMLNARYKKFVKYNYGLNGNTDVYRLENINVPVHLLYGQHDNLASPEDTRTLFDALTGAPNKTILGVAPSGEPPYNHIDFVFAKNIDLLFTIMMPLIESLL